MIKKIFKAFFTKEVILYVFFGVCTMILNTVVYAVLYQQLGVSNVTSTAVAWLAAVIAAYLTNRVWVFESKAAGFGPLAREFAAFLSCRVATGLADIAIMYVGVDLLRMQPILMKLLANVVVIVGNYLASKFFIFKK